MVTPCISIRAGFASAAVLGLMAGWVAAAPPDPRSKPVATTARVQDWVMRRHLGPLPNRSRPTWDQLEHAAIRGLLRMTEDRYTRFLTPAEYTALYRQSLGEYEDIGVGLQPPLRGHRTPRLATPVPGGPAQRAGLREGEWLLKIDGRSTTGMSPEAAAARLTGPVGSKVRVTVAPGPAAAPRTLTLTRAEVEADVVDEDLQPGGILYLSLSQFTQNAARQLRDVWHRRRSPGQPEVRGVVLDLRGNPGGLFDSAVEVAGLWLPPNVPVVTVVQSGGRRETLRTTPGTQLVKGKPMVVIVNRTTASASEILACALQDHHVAQVLGAPSFGKGRVQTVFPLQRGAGLVMSTARYLTPSGRSVDRTETHRGGVVPDHLVETTAEEFRRGEDAPLREAIRLVRSGLKP